MQVMTPNQIYFCDTYALIEIIGGNPKYKKFLKKILITSRYNLMELYYAFLRDYDEKTADKYFDTWSAFVIHIPQGTIKNAMKFKLLHKKDKMSYTDCIGYIFSIENGIMFLTGDIKFKNLEHVEFAR